MHIIHRAKIGAPIKEVRELRREEVHWILNAKESPQTQRLLAYIHKCHYWLACSCPHHGSTPPLLTVRLQNDFYSIVRMKHRGNHHEDCPFRFIDYQKKETKTNKPKPVKGFLVFHRPVSHDASESSPPSTAPKSKKAELTIFGRFLLTLLEKSDANKIYPEKLLPPNIILSALKHNAIDFQSPFGRLDRIIYIGLTQKNLDGATTYINNELIKKSETPYVVFLFYAEYASKRDFKPISDSDSFTTRYKLNGVIEHFRYSESHTPPYLMAVTYGKKDKHTPPDFLKAIAVPMTSSNDIFPVANHFEKNIVHRLRTLQRELIPFGKKINIEKPLFPVRVADELVTPDFVIKTQTTDIILDIYSQSSDSYIETKSYNLPFLQELGRVFTIDVRSYANEGDLNSVLDKVFVLIKNTIMHQG